MPILGWLQDDPTICAGLALKKSILPCLWVGQKYHRMLVAACLRRHRVVVGTCLPKHLCLWARASQDIGASGLVPPNRSGKMRFAVALYCLHAAPYTGRLDCGSTRWRDTLLSSSRGAGGTFRSWQGCATQRWCSSCQGGSAAVPPRRQPVAAQLPGPFEYCLAGANRSGTVP